MHQMLAHSPSIDSEFFITTFIDVLKPEIRRVVIIQQPINLDTTGSLALLQEEVMGIFQWKPIGEQILILLTEATLPLNLLLRTNLKPVHQTVRKMGNRIYPVGIMGTNLMPSRPTEEQEACVSLVGKNGDSSTSVLSKCRSVLCRNC